MLRRPLQSSKHCPIADLEAVCEEILVYQRQAKARAMLGKSLNLI